MIDEAGLYLLLDQASRLASDRIVAEAVAVRRADLLADPQGYRGRLVKVNALFAESRSFRPLNRRRYAEVAYSTLAWEQDSLEPVSLVTVDDPGHIGRKAPVVLAGYFFKLRRDQPRQPDRQTGSPELVVPVLVGRAVVVRPQPTQVPDSSGLWSVAWVVGVVVLAGLWFALRIRVNRQRRARRRDSLRDGRWPGSTDANAPENQPIDLEAMAQDKASIQVAGDDGASRARGEGGRRCVNCGAANRLEARFCDQCGVALGE